MKYSLYICYNKTKTDMTTKEIYNLANEMTEQEVLNVLAGWKNTNETKAIKTYNSLVRLGDSMQLSCATVIAEKINRPHIYGCNMNDFYINAYES